MSRFRLILALLVLAGAGLSACQVSATPIAASINGATIDQSSLSSALDGLSASSVRCVISGGGTVAVNGAGGSSTYSSSLAAALLTTFINNDLFSEQAAREHLASTVISKQLAADLSASSLMPTNSTCTSPGTLVLAQLPPVFRETLISLADARARLGAALAHVQLSHAGLADFAEANQAATTQYCVSAIVVGTAPAAQALVSAVRAGANFAQLAKAHSTDAASAAQGGALGCTTAANIVTALGASLEKVIVALGVGAVSAPVSVNGSWAIFSVTSEPRATDAEIASAVEQLEANKLSVLLTRLQGQANVIVDPAYGRWEHSGDTWQVVANTGPTASLVPNLKALTPSPTGA